MEAGSIVQRSDYEEICRAAKAPASGSAISFCGEGDPIYQSPLRLAAGTASVLANIGGAIDDIQAAQGGRRQEIEVDLGRALVGISSMWVLQLDGRPAVEAVMREATSTAGQGVYETRDGRWLFLQSGFAHLVERTREALGATSAEEIEAVVASRDAADLEAALVGAKLPGVIVREAAEWREHEQGRLLVDAPTVQLTQIGDAPPTPLPQGERPLSGLRVIDSTRVLAGPTVSRTLAAFGADVLHVGSPHVPDLEPAQIDTGHGKRRAFVDLETDDGKDAMEDLIAGADVFSQSYRAGALAARGLSAEAVAAKRPGIVYLSENAYGQMGPWREKRGFDGNVQAASGIHMLHQWERPQQLMGTGPAMAMNDYCTGYWGAYGVLEALKRRAEVGGSWHVTVALGQTASWFLRMGTPHRVEEGDSDLGWQLAERWSETVDSDYGELRRLSFPIEFSDVRPEWGRTVLPGSSEAVWL